MHKEKLSVVKIGGHIIEDKRALSSFLRLFSNLEGKKILIHGGGKRASVLGKKLGIDPQLVNGRRITDAETLEVITMVYGGLINKNIVAQLQGLKTNAIGLTGADGNSVLSDKRPVKEIDFGFVGDVKTVNYSAVNQLIESGFIPVYCAITHDGDGQLLNTNADTMASQIAVGMSQLFEVTLYYCFELQGVLKDFNDKNSVVKRLDSTVYDDLLKNGIISDGMLPKLENCFDALKAGVKTINMGNTSILTKENDNFTRITI